MFSYFNILNEVVKNGENVTLYLITSLVNSVSDEGGGLWEEVDSLEKKEGEEKVCCTYTEEDVMKILTMNQKPLKVTSC